MRESVWKGRKGVFRGKVKVLGRKSDQVQQTQCQEEGKELEWELNGKDGSEGDQI